MELEINCSEFCDSFPDQELDRRPLHDLCKTTLIDSQHSSADVSPLSPALLGVVWTFLSCGLLLVLFFLAFTIRCRKNRIVKMSSPNLNIVTLLGSCLTYSSAYLFGIQDASVGNSMEALVQMRLSMLCIGTSLVFGPILGKSWRLYKVFTQRVPDKRVIIKDLQLLGLVAVLVVADVILLVTWVLTDPIQCLQILGVSMKVTGRDVSCSLTNTHACASRYSDVWIALVWGCKGLLLLYGAYLAGLTNHVSSPPVNQSVTIMVGVNLLLLTAGLIFVLTRHLHSWPNLVFGFTSGGIFVCTTTVNCCVFLPQVPRGLCRVLHGRAMGHLLSLQSWWSEEGLQPLRTSSMLRRRQLCSRVRPNRATNAGGRSAPRGDRTPASHPAPSHSALKLTV